MINLVISPSIKNKWGCFPVARPSIDLLEDNERALLIAPFVFVRPALGTRPVQFWIALPNLEFDGESKRWWMAAIPGMKGRYEGPGRLAAVIHDEYCARGRDRLDSPYDSGEVHRVYYESARCAGLAAFRAESRWFGVRKFGPQFKATPGVRPYTIEDFSVLAPVAFAKYMALEEA
jgi:hypothetical protein